MRFALLSGALVSSVSFFSPALAELPKPVATFLDQHCVECHDADLSKGGLDLSALKYDLTEAESFKQWQRVFERVQDGEMPPKKKTQPEKSVLESFLAGLKKPLLTADKADILANGRVRSRRLTRAEYENTMHDLLGIDIPLKDLLPEDRASYGFETVAEGQQLSYHQLGRYLDVTDQALDEAFHRALEGDATFKKHYTPEQLIFNKGGNYRGPELRDGRSISWPITLQFFGRMPITTVPEDGWYRITLHDIQAVNPQKDTVWGTLRTGECGSSAPMLYMIGLVEATSTPRDLTYEAWIQKGFMLELKPNDAELRRPPTGAKGGNVSFKGRDLEKEGFSGIANRGIDIERFYPVADLATVRRNLFGQVNLKAAQADPGTALDKLVARFARRAFRRPVDQEQVAPYLELGRKVLAEGEPLVEALRASYRAILCSPRFLTFIEPAGALDDHAIANRLSYALWISMPDAQLTKLAASGQLHDPAILSQQVDRMLADAKSDRFIRSFTDQWLKLKEIDFTSPDTRQFRTFDPVVQASMLEETRAYVAELIKGDLAVTNLVDSDFIFLNSRLARHYGESSTLTPGEGLQKVSLSKADRSVRGGLMTQGALLKVTADGTHTSPVVRGLFINERLLGVHVPPPPPGIPAIEPDIRGATSIRDQLEKHRNNETCASCHLTIDPPGFALENFDPVGVWRTRYGAGKKGASIDPSGVTPEGDPFADLIAWKQIYSHRTDQLTRGFAQQFLTYATGAPSRFSDAGAIEKIVSDTKENGHGLRSIIRAAILSPIFLNK